MSAHSSGKQHKVKPYVLPVVIIIVFILSIYGHYLELTHLHEPFNIFGVIYATIGLFFMHHLSPTPGNNWILVAEYIATTLLFIGIFSLLFTRLNRFTASLRIRFLYSNHTIIVSLSNIGKTLALEMLEKGHNVVVIEHDIQNAFIDEVRKKGGIVLAGVHADAHSVDMAGISNARICVLADEHDEANIKAAGVVSSALLKGKGSDKENVVKILTHVKNAANEILLKDYFDIYNENEHYDLETFTVYGAAARKMYDLYPPHNYFNAKDKETENSIAIIGFNGVAETFILEHIILSHYPGLERIKLYLTDEHADTHFNYLNFKYPYLAEFIEIIPVKLLNANFYANFTISKLNIEKLSKVRVAYVFGDNDAELVNIAANFRQFLYTQTLNISQVPVIACLPEDTGVLNLFDAQKEQNQNVSKALNASLNIIFYRLITDTCTASWLIEGSELTYRLSRMINFFYAIKYEFGAILEQNWQIKNATAIAGKLEEELLSLPVKHQKLTEKEIEQYILQLLEKESNVSYKELQKQLSIEKRWNVLSYRKKDSNRYAARQVSAKIYSLKSIGCWPLTRENITNYFPRIAPVEHIRWSAEKMVFNFKYGPLPADKKEKNMLKDVLKIHDQLVAYEKLSDIDKEKDLNIFLMLPVLNTITNIAD